MILSRPQVIVSFAVVAVWLMSMVFRAVQPASAAQFGALDGAILVIFGFMFSSNAIRTRSSGS